MLGGSIEDDQISVEEYDLPELADRSMYGARKILPAPKIDEGLNIWAFLKNCIGKELTKITMPVSFNEPVSLLQRIAENFEYTKLLDKAAHTDDVYERVALIAAFQISTTSPTADRLGKPFNPILGETYELSREELNFDLLLEQVSHHPPVSAFHCTAKDKSWVVYGSYEPKLKFWGKSIEIKPIGIITLEFPRYESLYLYCAKRCCS